MSKLTRWTMGFVLPLCVAAIAMTTGRVAEANQPNSTLHTYRDVDGQTYFALSLQPSIEDTSDVASPRDILLLVDTSASQTGLYRERAIEAVETIVKSLRDDERVNIMAVDLKAVPMTKGFVKAGSNELKRGVLRLKIRTPLGSTDIVNGLKTAGEQFAQAKNRARSIIYIGDGISRANAPAFDEIEPLTQELIDARISVNSYAVGLQTDLDMLAVVANNTGGSVFVNGAGVTAQQAGMATLMLARGTVVWPTQVEWPSSISQAYPARVPPLRFDRETILIGTLIGKDNLKLKMTADVAGQTQSLTYDIKPQDTSKLGDYAMVPELFAMAKKTDGIMLPVLGKQGLQQVRIAFQNTADNLSKLGHQAIQRGDRDGGLKLLNEALRRDPSNARALALLKSNTAVKATSTKGIVIIAQEEDDPFGELGDDSDPFGDDLGGSDDFGGDDDLGGDLGDPFGDDSGDAGEDLGEGAEPVPAPADDLGGDLDLGGEVEPTDSGLEPAPSPLEPAPADPTPVVPNELEVGTPVESGVVVEAPAYQAPIISTPFSGEPMLMLGGGDEASDSDLLMSAAEEQRLAVEQLRTEVNRGLSAARDNRDATAALEGLKNLRESIVQSPDLPNAARATLLDKLEIGLRQSARRRIEQDRLEELARANLAAVETRKRFANMSLRKQEKAQQYLDQVNALLDEEKYGEAEETALELRDLAPRMEAPVVALGNAEYYGKYVQMKRIHEATARAFAAALYTNELAHIPLSDDPPIVYPDADVWARLSERRLADFAVDLSETGDKERAIRLALQEDANLAYDGDTLADVATSLKERFGIPIRFDRSALNDEQIDPTTEIVESFEVSNVSLKSALKLMLEEQEMTYVIRDEVLMITTQNAAESEQVTKVYPVADLVIPIMPMGGGGMMGGGMMGGMGGGMMGGMGGGMGGGMMGGMGGGMMGGMGGGMMGGMGGMGGGMMGGGMGGMMDVEDAISLKPSKTAPKAAKPADLSFTLNDKEATDVVAKRIVPAKRKASESLHATWNRYFAKLWASDVSKEQERQSFADVRETVRRLSGEKKFNEVSALIQAALRNGQFQPWMHQTLGMALRATNADRHTIERAFMSTVDLSQNPDQIVHVAMELSRNGFDERAMQLYRDIATAFPLRPEPYMHALTSAKRIKDAEGIRWACEHILAQAWPEKHKHVFEKAVRTAKATLYELKKAGKDEEYQDLADRLNNALSRDCIVRVTWTGDADVDLLVEEPSGTVCSTQNKRTSGGGVMLGDALPDPKSQTADGISETYVCPEGFSGDYHVLVRRIFGDVVGGKVTVEIATNVKTEEDGTTVRQHIRKQIDLTEKDAMITFKLEDGRRQEELDEQIAENAAVRHIAENQLILAQQFDALANQRVDAANSLSDLTLLRTRDPRQAARVNAALRGRGAVGFMPVIQSFPEGTSMMGNAVISADRRYVRITLSPFFSRIADVQTFNFATGAGQQQQGGAGGAGGVGGAGGAGGFGGGGFGGGGFGGGGGF